MQDDGPGWEQQQDNEERRRWEDETLKRHKALTAKFRAESEDFDRSCEEFREFMSNHWSQSHAR